MIETKKELIFVIIFTKNRRYHCELKFSISEWKKFIAYGSTAVNISFNHSIKIHLIDKWKHKLIDSSIVVVVARATKIQQILSLSI